jgi:hypothetical protein
MLNNELRRYDGLLVLKSEGLLGVADFTTRESHVDTYLEQHGALLAHMKFLKEHLQRIENFAVVTEGAFSNIMSKIANHFVHALVRTSTHA